MISTTAPVERTPDIQRGRVVVAGGAWVGQRSGFIGVAWSVWRSCSESQRLAGSGWLAGRQAGSDSDGKAEQSRARLNNGTRPHYCNTANQLDYNTWHGRRSSTRLTTLPLTITITIPLETAGQLGRRAGVRALRMYVHSRQYYGADLAFSSDFHFRFHFPLALLAAVSCVAEDDGGLEKACPFAWVNSWLGRVVRRLRGTVGRGT